MNPPYEEHLRSQGSYMPPYNQPYQQNSFNAADGHEGQIMGKNFPPASYGPPGVRNGPSNTPRMMQNQSNSQVQCAPVPPNNQMINTQMAQEFNAMQISQNQNHHPLSNQQPPNAHFPNMLNQQPPNTSRLPPNQNQMMANNRMPPAMPNKMPEPPASQPQQPYWQQSPRMPQNSVPPFQAAPYPSNVNAAAPYPNAYSGDGVQQPISNHDRTFPRPPPPGSQQPPNRMPNTEMFAGQNVAQQRQFRQVSPYTNGSVGEGIPPAGHHPQMNSNLQSRYPTSPGMVSSGGAPQYSQPPGGGMQPQGMMGSAGQPPQQQRKLDPDDMPSPIQVIEDDKQNRSGAFSTAPRGLVPPLVTTNFTVVDEGICSPRYIRSTIYNVPTTAEMLKQTNVPFALAISPFAHLHQGEHPLPIVNPGEEGPVRCNRCRAYMSPLMQFIDAGRRFQCMLCKTTTEVPAQYFTHLDHMGQRVDKLERAELCLGSYEFIVNKDYCKEGKFPNIPAFIFLIDVSYNAIRSGMVKTLCDNMKSVLARLPRENGAEDSKMRVGFVTYGSAVHFYNINSNLAQPQMLVVSDVNDMFMPFLDGFLVQPSEASHVIDSLMEQIPTMFAESTETETVLGPAIQAGLEALRAAECSGKLFIFHSTLPIAEAPGKLRNRDDRKLLGTEKEKTVLTPQTNFYNNIGQECVKAGVCVDLFLFNNAYIDIATLGQVCRLTCGQLYKYTYFQADIDGERFIEDLRKDVEKPIAFDGVLRVRTSTGIRPTDFTGCFYMSNTTDVELAAVNCDKSLSIEIKYDDKLAEEEGVYVQCAVLYTSCSGQRRLRVHNLALNSCNQMAELFRSCELDTILNFFLKEGVNKISEEPPKQIREYLITRSAQILACYRKNCAQTSSVGQLILPECLKLLPLYINCLIKCDALAGGQEISTDDRSFIMLAALGMDVDSSAAYLYPRLLPLHDMKPQPDFVHVPAALRSSIERLKDNGVYLLENGLNMFLWIGMNADPAWVQDVFGVPSVTRIDVEKNKLISLDTPLSRYVHMLLDQMQSERQRHMKLYIVRQGDKLELLFRQLLVEDRTTEGSASYVDFLCHLHKEIRTLLS